MEDALKLCHSINDRSIDHYRCKILENMALIYVEQFFYRSAKEKMDASEALRKDSADKVGLLKFKLKKANFFKKSGFYEKSMELFSELDEDMKEVDDKLL